MPDSGAPSSTVPVLSVQPDQCFSNFFLINTWKHYKYYHNIIHRQIRQTPKTKTLIPLFYHENQVIDNLPNAASIITINKNNKVQ